MVTADLIDSQKWEEITKLCRKSHDIVEATRLGAAIKETPSAPLSTSVICWKNTAKSRDGRLWQSIRTMASQVLTWSVLIYREC